MRVYDTFVCFNLIFLGKQKPKQQRIPPQPWLDLYPVLVVTGHNHELLCKRILQRGQGSHFPFPVSAGSSEGLPCEGQGSSLPFVWRGFSLRGAETALGLCTK